MYNSSQHLHSSFSLLCTFLFYILFIYIGYLNYLHFTDGKPNLSSLHESLTCLSCKWFLWWLLDQISLVSGLTIVCIIMKYVLFCCVGKDDRESDLSASTSQV